MRQETVQDCGTGNGRLGEDDAAEPPEGRTERVSHNAARSRDLADK